MIKNLIAVLVLAVALFVPAVYAEEPAPAAADAPGQFAEEETEFSFGTVKSTSDNQLVVTEYDYESNADVDVTYVVNAQTEFENAASLKEVAVGDSVDIDFLVDGNAKSAVAITVEKPLTEEEEAALETAVEDVEAPKE